MLVVIFTASFPSLVKCSALCAYTPLTATLHVTISSYQIAFIPRSIPRSQLFWLATSTRSLTGLSTVAVLTPPAHPVRAPQRLVTFSNRDA